MVAQGSPAGRRRRPGDARRGVHLGAGVEQDRVAALAWLTRARAARSQFADRFYVAVRESCSPEERQEAERRASLPLDAQEVPR